MKGSSSSIGGSSPGGSGSPTGTRARILAAAVAVVERAGAGHLTLGAAAAEAGLSKGGVLYHFPNKSALITAMVEELLARLRTRFDAHFGRHREGPNPTVRALLGAEQEQDETERAMARAILVAAAEDPSLLAPARLALAEWFREIEAEGELGIVVWLANEGIRFLDMLDLLPVTPAQRDALHARLLVLAAETRP